MRTEQSETTAEPAERESTDLDEFTGYEDGESYVVCDRTNPKAWIRSDLTAARSP
jgi:hypothetical protein